MGYKNKTTIAYSDDENELTVLVNEKPITKYKFVPYGEWSKDTHPCRTCAFNGGWCRDIKCTPKERKDGKGGCYKVI